MTIKSVTLSLSFQLTAMTTTMAASSTMYIAMAHANLAFQARRPPSISSLDSASRVIRDPRPPFGFRSNSPRQKARTTAPLHLSAKTHDGGVDNESKVTSNSGPLFSQGQPSYSPDLPYEILPFREVLRLLVPPTDSHQSTHNDEHDLELERHLQTGLSSSEAKSRLERIGPNSLRPPRKKSIWELWLKQFDDGLVQILVGVALASAAFSVSEVWDAVLEEGRSGAAANIISSGDVSDGIDLFQTMRSFLDTIANNPSLKSTILQSFVEPSIIIAILLLNAMVGVWQDLSARSSLEALEKMQPRLATVLRSNGGNSDENGVRNGNEKGNDKNSNGAVAAGSKWITEYDAAELVPGDVIKLRVGDSIPADARLAGLTSSTMYIDESSLTGESVSVGKSPWDEGISSVDVTRGEGEGASTIPIQDQSSMLFSGTLITRGSGTAVVVRTGPSTQMGRIQSTLSEAQLETEERKTPLGEQLDEFGTTLSYVIGGICLAVWLASTPRFGDSVFDSWIEGAIYYAKVGVALGVAAIPEGLPAVITLCLSLGTRRMAERNVIVRKLPSVETLGCTTTICTDKTGTLTSNQMTAVLLTLLESNGGKQNGKIEAVEHDVTGSSYSPFGSVSGIEREESISIPNGAVADANVIMTLCNDARLIGNDDVDDERETKRDGEQFTIEGEPTEASLLCLVEKLGPIDTAADFTTNTDSPESMTPSSIASRNNRYFAKNYDRYATLEFDRKRKSMSVLCSPIDEARTSTDGSCQLFVKGAPNFLLQRCNKAKLRNGEVVQLTPELRQQIDKSIVSIGDRALRCIGLAKKDGSSLDPRLWKEHEQYNDYLKDPNSFAEIESDLTFIGMVGIKDPAREGVAESIELCKRAGIRVIMITGDAKATATAIAKDVSIFEDNLHPPTDNSQRAFEGREFFALPESQQLDILRTGNLVICRAEPSDKQRLVKMLQSIDEIPAMTGDGVNDAPALQQASIGVAMGISGTDVAKEAADMVLVDDNFSTIVDAVEEGRCIYANMQAFINFLITCNIGEVISVFLAAILGLPQLFSPLMLLWCNLATDGPPATALGFNPPDPGLMNQKPRPTSEKILTPALLLRYTAAGLYIGIATVAVYVSYFFDHGVTFQELSTWSSCADTSSTTCSIFTDLAAPQTLALTTLVTTELLKALCTVSVDSSILTVYPWQNPWLILGVLVPFGLNLAIIYSESLGIPALGESFGLVPLQIEDWGHVLMWSIPIIFIDEALKYVFRRMNVAAVREG